MSQRHRGGSERPATPADVSAGADDARPPSSVRVIPRDRVEAALAAAGRPAEESNEAERETTVRPQHFEEVVGVVDPLRARRPVILELDDLADKKERRRAIDLMAGVAYGLDTTVSAIATNKHALLLEPHDAAVGHRGECAVPTADEAREPGEPRATRPTGSNALRPVRHASGRRSIRVAARHRDHTRRIAHLVSAGTGVRSLPQYDPALAFRARLVP